MLKQLIGYAGVLAFTIGTAHAQSPVETEAKQCAVKIKNITDMGATNACIAPFAKYLQSQGRTQGEAYDYAAYVVTNTVVSRFGIPPKSYVPDQAAIDRIDDNPDLEPCISNLRGRKFLECKGITRTRELSMRLACKEMKNTRSDSLKLSNPKTKTSGRRTANGERRTANGERRLPVLRKCQPRQARPGAEWCAIRGGCTDRAPKSAGWREGKCLNSHTGR